MKKRVLLPLATGFEEIEAITIADVLRRADVEVVLAGLEELHVKGAHGIIVVADALFADLDGDTFDMIALPGGLPGAFHLAEHQGLQTLLKRFDTQYKSIAAICAAPYALKTAGVLKNSYTCYPSFETKINHNGYDASQNIIVDQNITTSKGPSTAILFALSLVEHLCGKERTFRLKNELLFV
jgi:4-methyl-5(b-hydroxyethyl)-thiazole monophosphate biosynthesis